MIIFLLAIFRINKLCEGSKHIFPPHNFQFIPTIHISTEKILTIQHVHALYDLKLHLVTYFCYLCTLIIDHFERNSLCGE